MGKKLIIPNADFSQNSIVIPLSVTLGAGKSYILDGQTVTNSTGSDKTYEFSSTTALPRRTSSEFGQTNDAITKIIYGSPVNLGGSSFFKNFTGLKTLFFKDSITSTSIWTSTFENCTNLKSLVFSPNDNEHDVTSAYCMFKGCSSLQEVNLTKFNTANCTSFSDMFRSCSELTKITLGVNFVISQEANTAAIFNSCTKLSTFDCTAIDSTSTIGAALKTKIEDIITNSPSQVSNNLNVYWANGITRHWNGSAWSDAE